MRYETIKEFIKSVKKSRSTIYRFYAKNSDLFDETKLKNRKRIIPVSHHKYFNIEIMHDEYNLVCAENRSMKNLIDGLMDKESLCRTLWDMPWSHFITVAYKLERNKKSCYRMMASLYDELTEEFKGENINIFFTTESFNDRKGYHNHFVINISNEALQVEVVDYIKGFFNYNRLDIAKYDPFKAGLFYIAKEGLVNEDWDLFGTNLKTCINENKGFNEAV